MFQGVFVHKSGRLKDQGGGKIRDGSERKEIRGVLNRGWEFSGTRRPFRCFQGSVSRRSC